MPEPTVTTVSVSTPAADNQTARLVNDPVGTVRGFMQAPSGNHSIMRLVFTVVVVSFVVFIVAGAGVLTWIAVFHPDSLGTLGTIFGGVSGIWAFLGSKITKWKAVQRQWEGSSAPAKPEKAKPAEEDKFEESAEPADIATADEPVDVDAPPQLAPVSLVTPTNDSIPQEGIDFILDQEGIDQPSLVPPGESGISLGYGWDAGYEKNLERDWKGVIPDAWIARLKPAVGLKGNAARAIAGRFRDMHITSSMAHRVFYSATLPQELASARKTFSGFDAAPPLVRAAVLSLGYNRGWSLRDTPDGKTRKHMRDIAALLAAGNYAPIPECFRQMAPLWPVGNGVCTRRLAEAKLAQRGVQSITT